MGKGDIHRTIDELFRRGKTKTRTRK